MTYERNTVTAELMGSIIMLRSQVKYVEVSN